MTFQCWVFRGWVLCRWVLEAYYREYPTRTLELGIPDVGYSRRWVFQMLGIPYENRFAIANYIIFYFHVYFFREKQEFFI